MSRGPTATQVQEAQDALMNAARKLSEMPEPQEQLLVFKDYWGLEFYAPPQEVQDAVRNIVHGMVAAARAVSPTPQEQEER